MRSNYYYFLPCAIYIRTANGNTDISLEICIKVGGIVSFHFNTLAMYGFLSLLLGDDLPCFYCV